MADSPPPRAAQPSWRKPAAIASIVLLIAVWTALVGSLSGLVGGWPVLVQALFYLVVGVAWIVPLKPLLRWSETGQWRAPRGGSD
ncbi:DUF2842 domain-containing protein [Sphingomonas sp.]|uniref:DUF2842 domain-containing protein n=1 Tax=Sphingomonas sp. TaxID=28214 RepID=UPI00286E019D|nr:DUF2842 domain-containing protein [Sphingomonas sp.]